jgi:hypothetical protein
MCVGYCAEETVVDPTSIRSITTASAHRWTHPDRKTKGKITHEEWQDLQRSVDAPALAAFVGPIGCPGCADSPVEWIVVELSDGTKKSVSFNEGSAPPSLAPLLAKVKALNARHK